MYSLLMIASIVIEKKKVCSHLLPFPIFAPPQRCNPGEYSIDKEGLFLDSYR